jgi:hypothetical protein
MAGYGWRRRIADGLNHHDFGAFTMATATFKGKEFSFSSKEDVLALVSLNKLEPGDALKALALFDQPKGTAPLYCRVSQAGAVSVYGLQRMPVTLYVEQWARLAEFIGKVQEFAKEHAGALELKSDDEATKAAKAKHPKRIEAKARAAESAKKRAAA